MRLEYPGKKSIAEIMAQTGTAALCLKDSEGNLPFDGWRNMLIQNRTWTPSSSVEHGNTT